MHKIYKILFLIVIFITARTTVYAQITKDSLAQNMKIKTQFQSFPQE